MLLKLPKLQVCILPTTKPFHLYNGIIETWTMQVFLLPNYIYRKLSSDKDEAPKIYLCFRPTLFHYLHWRHSVLLVPQLNMFLSNSHRNFTFQEDFICKRKMGEVGRIRIAWSKLVLVFCPYLAWWPIKILLC